MNKLVDELEKTYNHTNQWLRFAESKNGALIALDSALIIGILTLYNSFSLMKILNYYFFWVISFLIISMVISSLSFVPILSKKDEAKKLTEEKIQEKNILFFYDILNLTPDEYLRSLMKKTKLNGYEINNYERDYAEQIINNSKITVRKYKLFKWALYFFVSGILPFTGLGFIIICIFRKAKGFIDYER